MFRYCNFDLSNLFILIRKVFGSILIFFYIKDVVRLVLKFICMFYIKIVFVGIYLYLVLKLLWYVWL